MYSTAARLVEPSVAKMRGVLTFLAFSEFSINEQSQAFFKQDIGLSTSGEQKRNGALGVDMQVNACILSVQPSDGI